MFKKGHKPWNKDINEEEYRNHYKNGFKGHEIGKSTWNKNIPMREETKIKLREKRKLYIVSEETKNKVSKLFKGKKWEEIYSVEGLELRMKALQIKRLEKKNKILLLYNKGKTIDEIIKESGFCRYIVRKYLKESGILLKKRLTEAHKKAIGISCKGKNLGFKHSETTKEKIRRNTILQHIRGFPQTNTSIELHIKDVLDKNNIKYEHPFNFNNKFACDFAVPSKKLIIECDGDYWHNREDIKKRDKAKNAYITTCGWNMLRFWEHEINNNISSCEEKICRATP